MANLLVASLPGGEVTVNLLVIPHVLAGVDFDEGGNKSPLQLLKLSLHAIIVQVGGVIDDNYAGLDRTESVFSSFVRSHVSIL